LRAAAVQTPVDAPRYRAREKDGQNGPQGAGGCRYRLGGAQGQSFFARPHPRANTRSAKRQRDRLGGYLEADIIEI